MSYMDDDYRNMSQSDTAVMLYNRYSTLPTVDNVESYYEDVIVALWAAKDKEANIERIIKLYHKAIGKYGADSLSLYSLMNDIAEYNEELFFNIAMLNVLNDPEFCFFDEEDFREQIEEETTNVADWFEYNAGIGDVERYVFRILEENKLSISTSEDDDMYSEIGCESLIQSFGGKEKEYTVVLADCQNVLFEELGEKNMYLYNGTTLLYKRSCQ